MSSRDGVAYVPFSSGENGLVVGSAMIVVALTLRCSAAAKKCVRFWTMGPPNEPPTRVWLNGGLVAAK